MKNLKYFIKKALKEHFALGSFNFSNMETLQSIVESCISTASPAIISISESSIKYMGENYLKGLVKSAKTDFPYIFLHLDHGTNIEVCKTAINLGFDCVMIDGSNLCFEENVKLTKEVCNYAHKHKVLVEGELGKIKGVEEEIDSNEQIFTSPIKAKEFVEKTGIDMLAISIGTSHGAYKYKGKPTLRFDILNEIEKQLPNFPLVLHGASTVDKDLVKTINLCGGNIKNAKGVSEKLLIEAVQKHNIIKINTDTDIRLSMTSEIRKFLKENIDEIDIRKFLAKGKEKTKETLEYKIKHILFSQNKIN